MIRTAAELVIGAAIILAVAFVLSAPPVRAAGCVMLNASWYGAESGSRTATGERFDGTGMTAASPTLPFGTRLNVTYRGRSVVVRVNDRGPYVSGRALDLSRAAAARLGMLGAGVARVCVARLN